jgi:NadR type nicotinamide-nucleotide adenylyltransferase
LKKIVITGPESTGKSTLAAELARHYNTHFTEEQARSYLNQLGRPYEYEDLEIIGARQIEVEDQYVNSNGELLFCDTDLLTIKIWSEFRYGKVSSKVLKWINNRDYHLYLLCKPDIPWEPDPLRENPDQRALLFDKHIDELIHYQKDFELIEGNGADRLELAILHIEKYRNFWGD